MKPPVLAPEVLACALRLRDLTDPQQGPHAMQRLVDDLRQALVARWRCRWRLHRARPIIPIEENYDRLHYPPDGAARDARYTRYVSERALLRTHMSAVIPPLLRGLAGGPLDDTLLVCPGLVYRRDCIDRLHTGEPHQLDLWRVRCGRLVRHDLEEMIATVVAAALPGRRHRLLATDHPYTTGGLEIEVDVDGEWVEIGECGLALPALLAEAGHDVAAVTGLAMGLGLDRILMVRKGIDDIRLLRSADERIARQMLDLAPWEPVSHQPPIRRDLSLAVDRGLTPEELGDRIREALGEASDRLESVEVLAETARGQLPTAAVERLGIRPGQKNVLLRLVIRDPVRTLTSAEANALRDRVYRAVHRGTRMEWAS